MPLSLWPLATRAWLLIAALALAACDGGPSDPAGPTSVVVTPPRPTLAVEDTLHLHAAAMTSAGGVVEGTGFIWTSSDTAVATVNAAGVVLGRRTGTATVTATSGKARGGVPVTVRLPDPVVWKQVVPAFLHTCGIAEGGTAYCWGYGFNGELGADLADATPCQSGSNVRCARVPLPVLGGIRFTSLALTLTGSCGLAEGGQTYCWGRFVSGGVVDLNVPTLVPGGRSFRSISGHGSNSAMCAVTPEGQVYCWAAGTSTPVQVGELPAVRSISVGGQFVCALTEAGEAYCWGANWSGQLGNGKPQVHAGPVRVSTDLRFVEISAGSRHACARTADGAVHCWGANTAMQLGVPRASCTVEPGSSPDDTVYFCSTPRAVSGGLRFVSVASGHAHSCGVVADGRTYCWGTNEDGVLGVERVTEGTCRTNSTYDCTSVPVAVSGGIALASVRSSTHHNCGISPRGEAYCWGWNFFGALGNPGVAGAQSARPVRVVEPKRIPNTRR